MGLPPGLGGPNQFKTVEKPILEEKKSGPPPGLTKTIRQQAPGQQTHPGLQQSERSSHIPPDSGLPSGPTNGPTKVPTPTGPTPNNQAPNSQPPNNTGPKPRSWANMFGNKGKNVSKPGSVNGSMEKKSNLEGSSAMNSPRNSVTSPVFCDPVSALKQRVVKVGFLILLFIWALQMAPAYGPK